MNNWIWLNYDVVKVDSDKAASGSFLRDQKAKQICGYNRCLEECSVLDAELMEILDGLNFMLSKKFENILIQTDSMEATKVIHDCFMSFSNFVLIGRID